MGDVIDLPTREDNSLSAGAVLLGAAKMKPTDLITLGWDKDGQFFMVASMSGAPDALWLLEAAKRELMEKYES